MFFVCVGNKLEKFDSNNNIDLGRCSPFREIAKEKKTNLKFKEHTAHS